jgi:cell division protein FtsW
MKGVQKLFYLPSRTATSFFGHLRGARSIGATLVIVCFCVITWRGLRVALARRQLRRFSCARLTTMVAVQAFVNMSVVLGLMPTKGIPLPFVSAGGSSLLINLMGMGVLLNVSQHASSQA